MPLRISLDYSISPDKIHPQLLTHRYDSCTHIRLATSLSLFTPILIVTSMPLPAVGYSE